MAMLRTLFLNPPFLSGSDGGAGSRYPRHEDRVGGGISYRMNGAIVHNKDRSLIEDMDSLPSVVDVYKRDLTIDNYYIGYLKHPYVSLPAGRGHPSRGLFHLRPGAVGGYVYRARSPKGVIETAKIPAA